MPALATAMVTGPSARSAAAKKACTDFSSRTSRTLAKTRSPSKPGRRAPHRVLAQIAQRHPASGSVERLGDAQADAGGGSSDNDDGIAEIEATHARCLSCHRVTILVVVVLRRA